MWLSKACQGKKKASLPDTFLWIVLYVSYICLVLMSLQYICSYKLGCCYVFGGWACQWLHYQESASWNVGEKSSMPFCFRLFHRLGAVGIMIETLPPFSGQTIAYFVLHRVSQSCLASLHSPSCFSSGFTNDLGAISVTLANVQCLSFIQSSLNSSAFYLSARLNLNIPTCNILYVCSLEHCFSKCGPWTISFGITWELFIYYF